MATFFFIATGGAIGAVSRFILSKTVSQLLGFGFPWGTLAVNLIGSLLIGALWAISEKYELPENVSSLIFIGILGSFTTFSSFSMETLQLFRLGQLNIVLLNILAQNIFGISMAALGFFATRSIIR